MLDLNLLAVAIVVVGAVLVTLLGVLAVLPDGGAA